MTKRIVLIVVFVLALLAGIFFYYRRAQRAAGTATPAGGDTGVTGTQPGGGAGGINTQPFQNTGIVPPSMAAPALPAPDPIKVAAASNLADVPCGPSTLFANGFDWRAHPKIKALWDDRKKVLQQTWYVGNPSPCADMAFLQAVANELFAMYQAGVISLANTKSVRTGTTPGDPTSFIFNNLKATSVA